MNKQKAIERLVVLLIHALHIPKIRKKKIVSKAAKAARVENKRILSAKKENRKANFDY